MQTSFNHHLLAVDCGNSCVKLGWFPADAACEKPVASQGLPIAAPLLPEPAAMVRIGHRGRDAHVWLGETLSWIKEQIPRDGVHLCWGSTNRQKAELVLDALQGDSCDARWASVRELGVADVPMEVRTQEPTRLGVDRLLGAFAANLVRTAGRAAITVDFGTAATVNLVDAHGAFCGGAILAGPELSLSALHGGTAVLPDIAAEQLAASLEVVGTSTEAAMASGAFWGTVGGVNEIVRRTAESCGGADLFLTGGGASHFAEAIALDGKAARHVPHLVLAGSRLVAERLLAP